MGLRRAYAFARISLCVAITTLSGCASHPDGIAGATASLRATLADLTYAQSAEDMQRAREDAIIARAIAAHEMRNP
jgi:starvation-inducible outer membrane lipoprotein